MSVLSRVQQREREHGDRESREMSSTEDSIPDSPVAARIRLVVSELTGYIATQSNASKFARFAWLIEAMVGEAFEEMRSQGATDEQLSMYMEQFGTILLWCGSGDNSVLPDNIADYIRLKHPQLAITTGG